MLKLYQFSACPFCWKVKVLLDYRGVPYETVEVDPMSKKELDFTDHKKVPVLRDGDKVITESSEIMAYLNTKFEISPPAADEADWCTWVDKTLVHYFPPIIHKDFKTSYQTIDKITPAGKGGRIKRQLTRIVGAAIMSKVAKKKAHKLGITDPEAEMKQAVDHWVNQGLKGRAFYGGDKPSLADLSVFGVFRSTEELDIVDMACTHQPSFAAWYQECKQQVAA
jgi:microsomal prostaglandin-E synthase 2